MITVIVETGAGLDNANSYVSVAECDTFHQGRLYAEGWTGATSDNKAAAVVWATRTIDQLYQFYGFKRSQTQALMWPRYRCPDPDSPGTVPGAYFLAVSGAWFDETKVPKLIKDATCDFARELLVKNRSTDPDSRIGIKEFEIFQGIRVEFDSKTQLPVIPDLIQNALQKVGTYLGEVLGRTAKLVRT